LTTTLSKTSGEVRIAGFDVTKDARQVREKVGIIFQEPSLDPNLTAEQNIRFHACLYGMCGYRPTFKMMPAAYRKKVLELAEVVGIQDALFRPIKKLSGGMQRKLEIIRSLIHTPDVLFLDEPTQGLDAVSRRSLWEYINETRKRYGTTVFLTTHYIDEAENVDRVCIINRGKIAACCTPEEMRKTVAYDPAPKVVLPSLEDAYVEFLNRTGGGAA
jgi:ABC-2 type transport system ATP-binding protein